MTKEEMVRMEYAEAVRLHMRLFCDPYGLLTPIAVSPETVVMILDDLDDSNRKRWAEKK